MDEENGQLLSFAPTTQISLGHPHPHSHHEMDTRTKPIMSVTIPTNGGRLHSEHVLHSPTKARANSGKKGKKTVDNKAVQFDAPTDTPLNPMPEGSAQEALGYPQEPPLGHLRPNPHTTPSPLPPPTPSDASPLPTGTALHVPPAQRRGPGRPKGSKNRERPDEGEDGPAAPKAKRPPAKRKESSMAEDENPPIEGDPSRPVKRGKGRPRLDRNLLSNRALIASTGMAPPKLSEATALPPGQIATTSQSSPAQNMDVVK